MLEPKKHILLSDEEADFSSSNVDPSLGGPQGWSPKNELDSEVALYIHHHKIGNNEGTVTSYQPYFLLSPQDIELMNLQAARA